MDDRPSFFRKAIEAKVSATISADDYQLLISAARFAGQPGKVACLAETLELMVSGVITSQDMKAMLPPLADSQAVAVQATLSTKSPTQEAKSLSTALARDDSLSGDTVSGATSRLPANNRSEPMAESLLAHTSPSVPQTKGEPATSTTSTHTEVSDQTPEQRGVTELLLKSASPPAHPAKAALSAASVAGEKTKTPSPFHATASFHSHNTLDQPAGVPPTFQSPINTGVPEAAQAVQSSILDVSNLPPEQTSNKVAPGIEITKQSDSPLARAPAYGVSGTPSGKQVSKIQHSPPSTLGLGRSRTSLPQPTSLLDLYLQHTNCVIVSISRDSDILVSAILDIVTEAGLSASFGRTWQLDTRPARRIASSDRTSTAPSKYTSVAPSVLVLVPGRATGRLVRDHFTTLSERLASPLTVWHSFRGCDDFRVQREELNSSPDIVVATLGSCEYLNQTFALDLQNVKLVVWADAGSILAPGPESHPNPQFLAENPGKIRRMLAAFRHASDQVRHVLAFAQTDVSALGSFDPNLFQGRHVDKFLEVGLDRLESDAVVDAPRLRAPVNPAVGQKRRASSQPEAAEQRAYKRTHDGQGFVASQRPNTAAFRELDGPFGRAAKDADIIYQARAPLQTVASPQKLDAPSHARSTAFTTKSRLAYAVKIDVAKRSGEALVGRSSESVWLRHSNQPRQQPTAGTQIHDSGVSSAGKFAPYAEKSAFKAARVDTVVRPPNNPPTVEPKPLANKPGAIPKSSTATEARSGTKPVQSDAQKARESLPAIPRRNGTGRPHRTLDTVTNTNICPLQTIQPKCTSNKCSMMGVCWELGCRGGCGKIHDRPCPQWLYHVCTGSTRAKCPFSHDERWKAIYARRKKH